MNEQALQLRKKIRIWIWLMIICIVLSGVTAFPLTTEAIWLQEHKHIFPVRFHNWIDQVFVAITETDKNYPHLLYGTDWLAFAHIVIALAFIGPLRDPVRNKWVIDWGMICCFAVFPLAWIAGPVRQIPVFHIWIDCSFGVIGLIPLVIVRRKIKALEQLAA